MWISFLETFQYGRLTRLTDGIRFLIGFVRRRLRLLIGAAVVFVTLLLGAAALWTLNSPLIVVDDLSDVYPRRSEHLTVNISGRHHHLAWLPVWKINGGGEESARQHWPRAEWPEFMIEIPVERLKRGRNEVVIKTTDWLGRTRDVVRSFDYDDQVIRLPRKIDWSTDPLEIQDGKWEVVQRQDGAVVRPVPGFEAYDRIALATGSFPINRRIETTVIFRHHILDRVRKGAYEYGFGIFSLWGGHPGVVDRVPREGWSFSLAWYWSKPGGVGNEISYRFDRQAPAWVGSYRSIGLEPDTKFNVVIEVRRHTGEGKAYIEQRLKWWKVGDQEPSHWLVTDDREGAPLPDGDYAVGLMAFNCQVEFGEMLLKPL